MDAAEYNAKADALNAKLRAIEARLAAHPMPVRVERYPFSFRRVLKKGAAGGAWGLYISNHPDADPRHWSECSIDEKCSLALALGDLCEEIDRQRAHMVAAVASAHAALDELEVLAGVKLE